MGANHPEANGPPAGGGRLVSVDAYRGFVMLAMVSSGLGMQKLMHDPTWGWLADQLEHRAWEGCTFWDLIQPSFMFIVAVGIRFSSPLRGPPAGGWAPRSRHPFPGRLALS